ncbi:MAG: lipopolysaccharide transport periplasmic protein LptA [Burkholderiaceae bacterium]
MTPLRLPRYAAWLTALAIAGMAGLAYAQAGSKPAEEPDTLILSDTLNYDDVKKESVFTGNVIMTRGLMTLHSDTLTMREDAEGFQYGTATVNKGKLVHIRQENPEKFEVIEAQGLRSEYDGKKEELEMIGQAVITRYVCGKPFDNVKGERVIYKQKTDTYEAYGGPNSAANGGRVRSLAQPRAKADAAAAECRKKSGTPEKAAGPQKTATPQKKAASPR